MRYRIALVEATNYKRLREIRVVPDADAALILIAGPNEAGKSSLMGAMSAALQGKKAQAKHPVHDGADDSQIRVHLTDVAGGETLQIERVILPTGETNLEVRGENGAALKSPQAALDRIVGDRFIDPLKFLTEPDSAQRATLIKLIDANGAIAKMDERRQRIFDKRRDVGRDLQKAEGELARLPLVDVPAPINVADLSAERARIADRQRANDGLGNMVAKLETLLLVERAEVEASRQRVERLERELAQARSELPAKESSVRVRETDLGDARQRLSAAAQDWQSGAARRLGIDAELARADAHNRASFAADASNKRRIAAAETVATLANQRDEQTAALDKIDAQKNAFLKTADLPYPGLGIDDDGLTLDGKESTRIPFSESSSAQRFRVAVAIACAASPHLADIWVRDAAVLDESALERLAEQVRSTGHRCWLEVIQPVGDHCIVISNGMVEQ